MILPVIIIILVLICAYFEYQKKLSFNNKVIIGIICILVFVVSFRFIKRYNIDNNEENFQDFKDKKTKEVFTTTTQLPKELQSIDPATSILSTNKRINRAIEMDKRLKEYVKNGFMTLDEANKLRLSMQSSNHIQRPPFTSQSGNNDINPSNYKSLINEPQMTTGITTGMTPGQTYIQKMNYPHNVETPYSKFYNKKRSPGHSYISPEFWSMPNKQPPVCMPTIDSNTKQCHPKYLYDSSSKPYFLELSESGDQLDTEDTVKETNVGSIMPKFNYSEYLYNKINYQ